MNAAEHQGEPPPNDNRAQGVVWQGAFRRRAFAWGATLAVVVAGGLGWRRIESQWLLQELPTMDLSQAAPAVMEAVDVACRQVRANPRSGTAWGELGLVLRAHDFDAQAESCLDQAARLDPREVLWPYIQGVGLTIVSPRRARDFLVRAVALRPDLELPHLRLAELLLDERRTAEADREFRAALGLNGRCCRAQLGLARLALMNDDLRAAQSWAQVAASSDPIRRGPHELLMQVFQRRGDHAGVQAEQHWLAQAASDDPGWPDPFVEHVLQKRRDPAWLAKSVQELQAAGQFDEALRLLDELIAAQPDEPAWPIEQARLLLRRNRIADAARVLEAAGRRCPRSSELFFQQGVVFAMLQEWPAAANALTAAISLKPDHAEAYYNLGQVQRRLHNREEALAAFRVAIRLRPDFAGAYINLGELLLDAGCDNDARAAAESARRLGSNAPELKRLERRLGGRPIPAAKLSINSQIE